MEGGRGGEIDRAIEISKKEGGWVSKRYRDCDIEEESKGTGRNKNDVSTIYYYYQLLDLFSTMTMLCAYIRVAA